jgi:glycosyltransferase involved in cell wall biosynthesis
MHETGLMRAVISVELTGWVERERLYELFAGARAFVYPRRFEGFGLPVV